MRGGPPLGTISMDQTVCLYSKNLKDKLKGAICGKTGKLGLTSILKNRRRRRNAAIIGVLPGLGARAALVAPLKLQLHIILHSWSNFIL